MNDTAVPVSAVTLSKYTVSFGISFAATSVVNALIVVAKETHPTTVMAWMQRATGHHWATHSLISLLLFFALGTALARGRGLRMTAASLVGIILSGAAAGGLIILGFYLFFD
ncbi:MAG: hypothetical protein ABSA05_13180 [Opitutaceae bacterium]|jgi:hypothetical protein